MVLHIAIVGAQGAGKTRLVTALRAAVPLAAHPEDVLVEEAAPLMQAASHALQHHDASLTPQALDHHRRYTLTLLLGLDLAAAATALAVREPTQESAAVDTLLRQTLQAHSIPYAVVYGSGPARTACALQAIEHHIARLGSTSQRKSPSTWQWGCETCSDAACEHLLFSRLVKQPSVGP